MEPAEEDSGTRKRSREKREKIEWKGEPPSKAREPGHRDDRDAREEKRRKSRDEGRISDRHEREYDRNRDHRKASAADTRVNPLHVSQDHAMVCCYRCSMTMSLKLIKRRSRSCSYILKTCSNEASLHCNCDAFKSIDHKSRLGHLRGQN